MKKLLILVISVFMLPLSVSAKSIKGGFNSIINNSGIDKNSISISIKNLNTGKCVYSLNDQILMHPASVQKMLTIIPAIEVLGEDYKFTTELYKKKEGQYLIKLSGDTMLKTSDLKTLISPLSVDTKRIYINDSIIEKKSWGEGWQWDDDMNSSMPRFNAYNLDNNVMKLTVMPDNNKQGAIIINQNKYPFAFINNVKYGEKNAVKAMRDSSYPKNTLILNGTVNSPVYLTIPSNNPKMYFDVKLTQVLEGKKIYLKEDFIVDNSKISGVKINEISHSVSNIVNSILKFSNNIASETLVKVAAANYYDKVGTDTDGVELFKAYCAKQHLDTSRIRLVDASGVSKNNLVTTDFVSEFLVQNKSANVYSKLAKPGEGTLANRMLTISNNLRAKTGTLSDISSIAGFLTSKKGNEYAFCIIINTPNCKNSDLKEFEDYIIREAYLRL